MQVEAELTKLIEMAKEEKRPITTHVIEYGRYSNRERIAIYNDGNKCYNAPCAVNNKSMEVRSAKAFVDYIREDLRRRENATGDKATVRLTLDGGSYCSDDNFCEDYARYKRLNSEQLLTLERVRNQEFSHEEFLQVLQSLKPSISDFQTLWEKFSKLRIQKNAQMNSNPIFDDDGENEQGYVCTYTITSGSNTGIDEEIRVPTTFNVCMPFVKAGDKTYGKTYDFTIDLVLQNINGKVGILVLVPDYETAIEQAIIDEAKYVKSELQETEKLLVLADL